MLNRRAFSLANIALATACPRVWAGDAPLKVVYFQDFSPYSSGKGAAVTGGYVDIMNEVWGKRLGLPLTHEGYPWARAQELVKHGDADAFISLVNDERKVYMEAGKFPLYRIYANFWTRANHPDLAKLIAMKEISDAKPYTISEHIGSSLLKTVMEGLKVEPVGNTKQALLMVKVGRSDLVMTNELTVAKFLADENLPADTFVRLTPATPSLVFVLQIRKTSPLMRYLDAFDKAAQAAKAEGVLDKLMLSAALR